MKYIQFTPHINKIYNNIQCSISDLKNLETLKNTEWLKKTKYLFVNDTNNTNYGNQLYTTVNVIFLEKGDQDLMSYLLASKNLCFIELLEILFAICYTLSIIQHKIPNFRHNDLKPNNLVILKNNKSKNSYTEYKVVDKTFLLKNRGYTVKLIDFDLACADSFQNQKIASFQSTNYKKIGYSPETNPVFDIHFFMTTLYKLLSKNISSEIKKFNNLIYNKNNPSLRLIPEDCFEISSSKSDKIPPLHKHVNNNKLTNYHIDGKTNYVPPEMKTPLEMIIHSDNIFEQLEKNNIIRNSKNQNQYKKTNKLKVVSNKCNNTFTGSLNINDAYTSTIDLTTIDDCLKRNDMCNVMLNTVYEKKVSKRMNITSNSGFNSSFRSNRRSNLSLNRRSNIRSNRRLNSRSNRRSNIRSNRNNRLSRSVGLKT